MPVAFVYHDSICMHDAVVPVRTGKVLYASRAWYTIC